MTTMLAPILWVTAAMLPAQETGPDSNVAAKIRELEQARFEAQRRKDNLTLDAMLDNALVWVDPNGVQLTKAGYMAKLRSAGTNVLEIRPVSTTIRVLGTTAVVSGIYWEKGVKGGRPYVQRARFITTWAFKNGR